MGTRYKIRVQRCEYSLHAFSIFFFRCAHPIPRIAPTSVSARGNPTLSTSDNSNRGSDRLVTQVVWLSRFRFFSETFCRQQRERSSFASYPLPSFAESPPHKGPPCPPLCLPRLPSAAASLPLCRFTRRGAISPRRRLRRGLPFLLRSPSVAAVE